MFFLLVAGEVSAPVIPPWMTQSLWKYNGTVIQGYPTVHGESVDITISQGKSSFFPFPFMLKDCMCFIVNQHFADKEH